MNILDSPNKTSSRYEPNHTILIALASLIILGLRIQLDAIYSDYLIHTSRINNPGLTICAYSPYLTRGPVLFIGILGLGLSCSFLYKRQWEFLESNLYNLILLSPAAILILDQLMMMKILK